VIERFQKLMGEKAKHEDVAQGKDDINPAYVAFDAQFVDAEDVRDCR